MPARSREEDVLRALGRLVNRSRGETPMFSAERVAAEAGMAGKTAKKHLNALLERGLVSDHHEEAPPFRRLWSL